MEVTVEGGRETAARGEQVRPVDGVTDAARLTVPVKPLREFTEIVDVPVTPALTGTIDGLGGEKPKSTTWKSVGLELWEDVPVVAVPATDAG